MSFLFLIPYTYCAGGSIPTNVALNQPTSQSSQDSGGSSERAVDGNHEGVYDENSCTHTDESGGAHWWQVDLGNSHDIGRVSIYHRTDCCQDRLAGAEVIVSATSSFASGEVCEVLDEAAAQPELVDCNGRAGRYVTVSLRTGNPLTLCEVEVFPSESGTGGKTCLPRPAPRLALPCLPACLVDILSP